MRTGIDRYWHDLFPLLWKHVIEQLVTCNGKYKLEQLELMPRWTGNEEQNIMARYIVFKTGAELIAYCKRTKPHTLQLGGIFPLVDEELSQNDPKAGRVYDRQLIKAGVCSAEGPLKIDLDIKDYDRNGVCNCIKDMMCVVCWDEFMHSSRILIDYILRNVFYFSNIYHFWSGNRGLHIWCFDSRVLGWSKSERATFIDTIRKRENIENSLPEHLRILPWPKFDVDVTKDPTHPLRIPFAPHCKTGGMGIMLPFLADEETQFDPKHNKRKSTTNDVCMIDLQRSIDYIKTTWV